MWEKEYDESPPKRPREIVIEVLTATGCDRCLEAHALVKSVTEEIDDDQVRCHTVNVLDHLDYAVALGVLSTPAIAINGTLVFTKPPSARKLRAAIEARLPNSAQGSPQ
jgi:thioredoxin 1